MIDCLLGGEGGTGPHNHRPGLPGFPREPYTWNTKESPLHSESFTFTPPVPASGHWLIAIDL